MARRERPGTAKGGYYIVTSEGYIGPFKTETAANDEADAIEDEGGNVLDVTDRRTVPPSKKGKAIPSGKNAGDKDDDNDGEDFDLDAFLESLDDDDDDNDETDNDDKDDGGDDKPDESPAVTHKWFKEWGT